MEKMIAQGAEAILIHQDNHLIKDRIKKSYRLSILDDKLRKQRTKKEAKLLEKASKLIPVPKLIKTDNKEKIEMEYIEGKKLSDFLDSLPNAIQVCEQIGKNIAILHDSNIIHGDLTTSNMIYVAPSPKEPLSINSRPIGKEVDGQGTLVPYQGKVYFIDFGLGFESKKIEDKAVDLHLIKQALEAKHFNHYEKFFQAILEGYKLSKHHIATVHRLKAVEKRGRYKQAG